MNATSATAGTHFLAPGTCGFGAAPLRLATIVAGGVVIAVWHPQRQVGGMCHFTRPHRKLTGRVGLDGRYADEGLALLKQQAQCRGTRLEHYRVNLFGASSAEGAAHGSDRPGATLDATRALLELIEVPIAWGAIGGERRRELVLDMATGYISLEHHPRGPSHGTIQAMGEQA